MTVQGRNPMNNDDKPRSASRRAALRAGLAGGAAALVAPSLAAAAEANPANLPPNVADWTRMLGEGVAAQPYGKRAKYEEHIARRDVSWLTASPQSSVSFTPLHEIDGTITPNGLCFERHHSGIAEVNPTDYRLMIHGLVEKPLIFTLDDIKRIPRYRA
jgi:sulfane dehydrogenase subunit SoxC